MTSVQTVPVSDVAADNYEPFMVEGQQVGSVHWLRTESGGDGQLFAGLWTCEPRVIPYVFGGDETMHVLEGAAHIDLGGGESLELKPGSIASFRKGQVATWTITKPFKKFFVVSG
jgi:uncharacterized cupin superfamily protein